MSACHDRVLAALELGEPDRVPTLDVMEEYSNIYEILGKSPLPLGFRFSNQYTGRVVSSVAPLINGVKKSASFSRAEGCAHIPYAVLKTYKGSDTGFTGFTISCRNKSFWVKNPLPLL